MTDENIFTPGDVEGTFILRTGGGPGGGGGTNFYQTGGAEGKVKETMPLVENSIEDLRKELLTKLEGHVESLHRRIESVIEDMDSINSRIKNIGALLQQTACFEAAVLPHNLIPDPSGVLGIKAVLLEQDTHAPTWRATLDELERSRREP